MAAADTFRTHKKKSNFTMIQNALIEDKKLSWAAKGMLIYLLSKPDGWKVYTSDIVNHCTNGRDSVKTIVKELREAGYVTLTKIIDGKGRVQAWQYDVYEEPLESPVKGHLTERITDSENTDCPETDSPEVAFPDVENPESGKAPTSNTELSNTDISNTQSIYQKEETTEAVVCAVNNEIDSKHIEKAIKGSIEFDVIKNRPEYEGWLSDWIELLVDCLAGHDVVQVNRIAVKKSTVLERLLKLDAYHFLQVKENLNKVDVPIKNMRNYLLTALYNIVLTSDAEIENAVHISR